MTRIGARRVLAHDGVREDAVLVVEDGRVRGVEPARPGDDLRDAWLVPGFVDTHTHGGGGVAFADPDPTAAIEVHRRHGSTSIIGSTVTGLVDDLVAQASRMADLVDAGELAGIHLEGPCLAEARKGAHEADLLRDPTPDVLDVVLDAGRNQVRMVTLATERAGGLEAVARLRARGVRAAFGHSDADAAGCRAAIDAGATIATHLFNAMRGIHHREPGPVPVLLHDPRVTVELICDGHHLAPEVVAMAVDAAGWERVSLVTDAMAAAGMPDGDAPLGPLTARVVGGVARILLDDGSLGAIAGSTLTMDAAVAFMVREVGRPLEQAARMASTIPARALGLADVGDFLPGRHADACVLREDGTLLGVLRRGEWIVSPEEAA